MIILSGMMLADRSLPGDEVGPTSSDEMPFATPLYSPKQVNAAGRNLIDVRDKWLNHVDLNESDRHMVMMEYYDALDIP
jgi:hypothetical protein